MKKIIPADPFRSIYLVSFYIFITTIFMALLNRGLILEDHFRRVFGGQVVTQFLVESFYSEMFVITVLFLPLGIALYRKSLLLLICSGLFILIIILAHLVDGFLLSVLTARLTIENIIEYGAELRRTIDYITPFLSTGIFYFILLGVMFFSFTLVIDACLKRKKIAAHFPNVAFGISALSFIIFVFGSIFYSPSLPDEQDNVLLHLAKSGKHEINQKYSKVFVEEFKERTPFPPPTETKQGLNIRPNIIMVIVESYSIFMSQKFSEKNNFTPHIDKIASENTVLQNFMANTYASKIALENFFSGRYQLPFTELGTEEERPDALPNYLRKKGYETIFLTTGILGFTAKNSFLPNVGFNFVEGSESPYYDDMERLVMFTAAHDGGLYARALDKIGYSIPQSLRDLIIWKKEGDVRPLPHEKSPAKAPYFMAIETVSTHTPYQVPYKDENSKGAVFKYADKALYEFYEALKENNFFENGILIITADHADLKSRTRETENDAKFQYSSYVPFIIATDVLDLPPVIEGTYQQTDFFSSIQYLVSEEYTSHPYTGNLFVPSDNAECFFCKDSLRRSIIFECKDKGRGRLLLAGDHTKIIDAPAFSEEEKQTIIDYVNGAIINNLYK